MRCEVASAPSLSTGARSSISRVSPQPSSSHSFEVLDSFHVFCTTPRLLLLRLTAKHSNTVVSCQSIPLSHIEVHHRATRSALPKFSHTSIQGRQALLHLDFVMAQSASNHPDTNDPNAFVLYRYCFSPSSTSDIS
jgi:hypothetical protein